MPLLQGYLLSSVRRKLKPRLVGRPGAEIAALRRGGEVSTTCTVCVKVAVRSLLQHCRSRVPAGHCIRRVSE